MHARWKHHDKMGVLYSSVAILTDIQDSILLAINQDNVQDGCYDGGYGPNNEELTTHKTQPVRRRSSGFWGYFKIEKSNQKETNRTSRNGLLPTKKEKNVKEMLQGRVATAGSAHNMKISKILRLFALKWQFQVIGTTSGKTLYKVDICNTPTPKMESLFIVSRYYLL